MEAIFAVVVFAVALFWILGRPNRAPTPDGPAPRFSGPGDFKIEVVGESYYQDALERIAGRKTADSVEHPCIARLEPEPFNRHDKNAVAILYISTA